MRRNLQNYPDFTSVNIYLSWSHFISSRIILYILCHLCKYCTIPWCIDLPGYWFLGRVDTSKTPLLPWRLFWHFIQDDRLNCVLCGVFSVSAGSPAWPAISPLFLWSLSDPVVLSDSDFYLSFVPISIGFSEVLVEDKSSSVTRVGSVNCPSVHLQPGDHHHQVRLDTLLSRLGFLDTFLQVEQRSSLAIRIPDQDPEDVLCVCWCRSGPRSSLASNSFDSLSSKAETSSESAVWWYSCPAHCTPEPGPL